MEEFVGRAEDDERNGLRGEILRGVSLDGQSGIPRFARDDSGGRENIAGLDSGLRGNDSGTGIGCQPDVANLLELAERAIQSEALVRDLAEGQNEIG